LSNFVIKESVIEAELVRRVEAAGGVCEKTICLGGRGFFDRTIVLPEGRVVFAEVKKPRGGVVSAHQKARHARYRALGAEVILVKNSSDIDLLLADYQ
jgi:hypothetical protein